MRRFEPALTTLFTWVVQRDRLRQAGPFALALGLHGLLLMGFVTWRVAPVPPMPDGVDISLVAGVHTLSTARDLAVKPPTSPPVQPRRFEATVQPPVQPAATLKMLHPPLDPPRDLQPIKVDVVIATAVALEPPPPMTLAPGPLSAVMAAAGGGKACQIFDALQATLQTNPEVRRALALVPRSARSVANAIMFWDGHWSDPASVGGPTAFDPVQAAVISNIDAASPNCRLEIVRGPRMITVGDANDTIVVAFGSGEWRWADLLEGVSSPQLIPAGRP